MQASWGLGLSRYRHLLLVSLLGEKQVGSARLGEAPGRSPCQVVQCPCLASTECFASLHAYECSLQCLTVVPCLLFWTQFPNSFFWIQFVSCSWLGLMLLFLQKPDHLFSQCYAVFFSYSFSSSAKRRRNIWVPKWKSAGGAHLETDCSYNSVTDLICCMLLKYVNCRQWTGSVQLWLLWAVQARIPVEEIKRSR